VLISGNVLHLLPRSNLGAESPRHLPHSTVLTVNRDKATNKGGRPTHIDVAQRTQSALHELSQWVEQVESRPLMDQRPVPELYLDLKSRLKSAIPEDKILAAQGVTVARMQDVASQGGGLVDSAKAAEYIEEVEDHGALELIPPRSAS
jgi:hypothetical protein